MVQCELIIYRLCIIYYDILTKLFLFVQKNTDFVVAADHKSFDAKGDNYNNPLCGKKVWIRGTNSGKKVRFYALVILLHSESSQYFRLKRLLSLIDVKGVV